jgi:hypothetical protein
METDVVFYNHPPYNPLPEALTWLNMAHCGLTWAESWHQQAVLHLVLRDPEQQ